MRNLKKILALVLALMMTLSLMVTASAADFTDQDDIKYTEAVDVMNAIGVLEGGDGGNFYPNSPLDRAAASKIVAYMLLTKDVASKLGTPNAPFNDVAADAWYAGPVAYCASRGIISGAGDGNFYPGLPLDGYSFGKMLLLAAGIGEASDYEGANWQVNVATALVQNKLDAGIQGLILSNTLDRQTAAQLAFNALKHGEEIVTTSTKYVLASTAETVTDANGSIAKTFAVYAGVKNGKPYDSYDDALNAGQAVVMNTTANATTPKAVYGVHFTITPMTVTETITLGSIATDVYHLSSYTTPDDFGNPVKTWTRNNRTIAEYPVGANVEYTSAVTGGKIYSDLGLTRSLVNHTSFTVVRTVDGKSDPFAKTNIVSGNQTEVAGNGALTKVYYNAVTNTVTITVMNTYVGTISNYTAQKLNADGQIETYEGITVTPTTNAPAGTLVGRYITSDFSSADASTNPDRATVVLYTAAWDEDDECYYIDDVTVPNKVTTVATRINANNTIVAGGTTYAYSAQRSSVIGTLDGAETILYLDNYGNIIHHTGVANAAPNYAVVLGYEGAGASGSMSTNGRVQLLLTDGSNVIVTYALVEGYASLAVHDVVSYTVNAEGIYVLKQECAASHPATIGNESSTYANGNITTNVPAIADGILANNRTIFLVKTGTAATAYTAYVGISNVPNITGANGNAGSSKAAILDANDDGIAELVYLNVASLSGSTSSSKDLVFIAGSGTSTTELINGVSVTTYAHAAVVNGQITTVTVGKNSSTGNSYITDNVLSNAVTYVSGVITDADAVTGGVNAQGTGDISGEVGVGPAAGLITIGGTEFVYSDNTAVYLVSDNNKKIEQKAITDIAAGSDIIAGYVIDNVVSVLYYKSAGDARLTLDAASLNLVVGTDTTESDVAATFVAGNSGLTVSSYAWSTGGSDLVTLTNGSAATAHVAIDGTKTGGTLTLTCTATLSNGTKVSARCTVTCVTAKGASVTLSESSGTLTATYSASTSGLTAVSYAYSSNKTDIATVSGTTATGTVAGVANGTATITVTVTLSNGAKISANTSVTISGL